jgi:hypothetical protein
LNVKLGDKQFEHRFLVASRMPKPIRCFLGNDIGLNGACAPPAVEQGALVASIIETVVLGPGEIWDLTWQQLLAS